MYLYPNASTLYLFIKVNIVFIVSQFLYKSISKLLTYYKYKIPDNLAHVVTQFYFPRLMGIAFE